MGKELTPAEMRRILLQRAANPCKDDSEQIKIDLIGAADQIYSNLMRQNRGHARYLLQDPQELIDLEHSCRNMFFELTGIDSRNAELPTKDGSLEAE